jgi:hypothetical protein
MASRCNPLCGASVALNGTNIVEETQSIEPQGH